MFKFWGDGSQEAMDLVKAIRVRSTDNFNWSAIFATNSSGEGSFPLNMSSNRRLAWGSVVVLAAWIATLFDAP